MREAGSYNSESLERDLSVLRLLNAVPSLDPFLLREHLRNNGIEVSPSYFTISDGDSIPGAASSVIPPASSPRR